MSVQVNIFYLYWVLFCDKWYWLNVTNLTERNTALKVRIDGSTSEMTVVGMTILLYHFWYEGGSNIYILFYWCSTWIFIFINVLRIFPILNITNNKSNYRIDFSNLMPSVIIIINFSFSYKELLSLFLFNSLNNVSNVQAYACLSGLPTLSI